MSISREVVSKDQQDKLARQAEAIKELREYKNEPLGFCPLTSRECNIDCVSYVRAYVGANGCFIASYCQSPMVTGKVCITQ